MKNIIKLFVVASFFFASCEKNIDLYPQSNITTENFYNTNADIQIELIGCYNCLI